MLLIRFLSSTAHFAAPNDGGSGNPTQPPKGEGQSPADTGAEDTGAGDTGDDNSGDASGESGDEDTGDAEGGEGDDDGAPSGEGDEDDDDDLASIGLTPEQKAKIKAKLEKETRWRDRQIDRLYNKKRQAEADAEAAAAIASGRAPKTDDAPKTEEEIRAAAQRLNAQDQYDRDCNNADAAGRKAFGDKWDKALGKLPKLGGVEAADMVTIMATDNPAMVLYTIANDPDEYERVMALPPSRRHNEFVKIGMKPLPKPAKGESKRPGNAPAPVTPLGGNRAVAAKTVNLFDDKVDDDAWYAARNATRARKFSNVQ